MPTSTRPPRIRGYHYAFQHSGSRSPLAGPTPAMTASPHPSDVPRTGSEEQGLCCTPLFEIHAASSSNAAGLPADPTDPIVGHSQNIVGPRPPAVAPAPKRRRRCPEGLSLRLYPTSLRAQDDLRLGSRADQVPFYRPSHPLWSQSPAHEPGSAPQHPTEHGNGYAFRNALFDHTPQHPLSCPLPGPPLFAGPPSASLLDIVPSSMALPAPTDSQGPRRASLQNAETIARSSTNALSPAHTLVGTGDSLIASPLESHGSHPCGPASGLRPFRSPSGVISRGRTTPRADAIGGYDFLDPLLFVGGRSDEQDPLQMPGSGLQDAWALEAGRPASTVSTPSGEGNPPQWPSLLPGVACSLPIVPAANVTSVPTPGAATPAAAFGIPGQVEAYAENPTLGQVSVPPLEQPGTSRADMRVWRRTDASRDVENAAGTGPWLPSEAAPLRITVPLMGHQEQGLHWMTQMEQSHWRGGILADGMGLGKTVQTLALIVSRPPSSPDRRTTLVVAPTGLVPQWKREIERLLPPDPLYARVHVYHGSARRTRFEDLMRARIVLTTFSTVMVEFRRQSPDSLLLGVSSKWHRVILDEAQSIKNDRSKVAIACCALDATYRWCLSGTPVMNSPREFCSLLRFLRVHPSTALDVSNTTRQPASDTTGRRNRQVAMAQLQALAKEVMLRRTQASTLGGQPIISLPAIQFDTVHVSFSSEEQRLYAALESRTRHHFRLCLRRRRVRSSDMLGLLQRLRQACCHPFLVPHVTDDTDRQLEANAQRFAEAVVARLQDNEHVQFCPICLTQVGNPLIFFPCGHSICAECFEQVAADDRQQHPGSAQSDPMRCPTCRTPLDLSQITDYASFFQCHYAPPADSTDDHTGLILAAGLRDGAHQSTSGDHTGDAAAGSDLLARFGLRHDGPPAEPLGTEEAGEHEPGGPAPV
ncbi:hypothetical protein CBS147347_11523 [Aspergillus niger]|nr:hypothetical protein CBS147347_11523 [Aspergillus niger]